MDEIEAVEIDGAVLDDGRCFLDLGQDVLAFIPEPEFFDGQVHDVDVSGTLDGRRAKLTARFASDYRFGLDASSNGDLTGWIFDRSCSGRAVRLVLETADGSTQIAAATLPRTALHGPAGAVGFHFSLPPLRRAVLGRLTSRLRVAGTGYYPFGDIECGAPTAKSGCDPCAKPAHGAPFYRRLGPARILVAIVVHDALHRLRYCLDTVLGSRDAVPSEVIVVDATSPGSLGHGKVLAICAGAGVTYFRADDDESRGAALDRALRTRPDHDVVILDPTVSVPAGWLDALYRACVSRSGAGAAAPLVAARTIDPSVMEDEAKSASLLEDLNRFASLARQGQAGMVQAGTVQAGAVQAGGVQAGRGTAPEIATASSACLYIRRDALNAVGGVLSDIDANADDLDAIVRRFIARAAKTGWRCVLAADTCLDQLLSAPGGLKLNGAGEQTGDPADSRARSRLRRLRISQWRMTGQTAVLITHALPGGTARHVTQLTRELAEAGRRVIVLQGGASGYSLSSMAGSGNGPALHYDPELETEELQADLFALSPDFFHVHHLIDLPRSLAPFLMATGIPIVVTIHDFFFGCPRVTLLDDGGGFCGAPAAAHCTPCLAAGAPHPALHPSLSHIAESGVTWRGAWKPLLAAARQIIAPSRSAADLMQRLFPGLAIDVRPHRLAVEHTLRDEEKPARDPTRVAAVGTIGHHKGVEVLHDLVRHCARYEPDLRFVVIGETDRDEAFLRYGNVEVTGPYASADSVRRIASAGCAVGLFLSVGPETFCFTLSEAVQAGLVPVAHDIGALGERLRDHDVGIIVPLNSSMEVLVKAIRMAAQQEAPRGLPDGGAAPGRMFGDYYTSDFSKLPAAPHAMVGAAEGVSLDLWCEARFSFTIYSRRPLRSVTLTFWYHPDHVAQKCLVTIDGQRGDEIWLRPGTVQSLNVAIDDRTAHLLTAIGQFDFSTPLEKPDRRRAAAKLMNVVVTGIDGNEDRFELSPPPILRDAPSSVALA